jgi:hypothetical protein
MGEVIPSGIFILQIPASCQVRQAASFRELHVLLRLSTPAVAQEPKLMFMGLRNVLSDEAKEDENQDED